jgi:hypothetical protein
VRTSRLLSFVGVTLASLITDYVSLPSTKPALIAESLAMLMTGIA